MVQAQKKPKVEKDKFAADGVRMFNPSKEHGVVYCDGYIEVKYIQEYEGREVHYRGDYLPVGYKEGEPLPKHAEELLDENTKLQARIAELESAQAKTNALLERLLAQSTGAAAPPAQVDRAAEEAKTTGQLDTKSPTESQARGAAKPK
jgi:hypothetical protein